MEDDSGIVQVSNRYKRSIQVKIDAYPVVMVDGKPTAALDPFPSHEQEKLIRFRPSGARMRSKSTQNIKYTILEKSTPFYLCITTLQDTLLLRICSARR